MANGNFIEYLIADVKYTARILWRSPAFAATAIVALALGIGANTAIFSVVNTVLLQPLSYPQPDRLVALERRFPEGNGPSTSIPKFTTWREQTQVFQAVAAYDFAGPGINLTGGDRPEQVKGIHASASYFEVFGAPVVLGRVYTEEEDRPGGPRVLVISNGLWRGRYGAIRPSSARPSNLPASRTKSSASSAPSSRPILRQIYGCRCNRTPTARIKVITCYAQRACVPASRSRKRKPR